jgi:hypothetical protein
VTLVLYALEQSRLEADLLVTPSVEAAPDLLMPPRRRASDPPDIVVLRGETRISPATLFHNWQGMPHVTISELGYCVTLSSNTQNPGCDLYEPPGYQPLVKLLDRLAELSETCPQPSPRPQRRQDDQE